MRAALLLCAMVFAGCSTPAPQPGAVEKPAPPADESALFPKKDLVSTRVAADHALDPSLAPGGTIGEYKTYRAVLIHMPAADQAAFFLLDAKKAMQTPRYLAHMGGYFGTIGDKPAYVFAKGSYVVGLKGLQYDAADVAARVFAAALPNR